MAFYAWRTLTIRTGRWAALPVNLGMVETYCAAAIYDQNDSRKRIFTIGAAYLVEEDRGDKRARNQIAKNAIQRLCRQR
jgi:hypothetical protein